MLAISDICKILLIILYFFSSSLIAQTPEPILVKDTATLIKKDSAKSESKILLANGLETTREELEKEPSISADVNSIYIQFETKVLFESGEHGLSHKDKHRLNVLADELKHEVNLYRLRYPNEKLVLVIGVIGYTDEMPFYAAQNVEERKLHNLQLSKNRAQSVRDYLKHHLHHSASTVEGFSDGQGEEIPYYVHSEDPHSPQRRSCLVHALIYNELGEKIAEITDK